MLSTDRSRWGKKTYIGYSVFKYILRLWRTKKEEGYTVIENALSIIKFYKKE